MNYYRRYSGDYMRDTAHLSLAEHGAYNVLLDTQYSSEKGLPGDHRSLCRICRAESDEEKQAVKSVADQFFPTGDDGLRWNPRAAKDIPVAQDVIGKQREGGALGGHRKWGTSSNREHTANRSQRLREAREKGIHTTVQWEALLYFCGNKCVKCGAHTSIVKDHIVPIYQGGSDGIENLQPLCRSCNSAKGADNSDHRNNGWVNSLVMSGLMPRSTTSSRLHTPNTNHHTPTTNHQPPTRPSDFVDASPSAPAPASPPPCGLTSSVPPESQNQKPPSSKSLEYARAIELPAWLSADDWREFLEHRKKLKAPMTDVAQKRAIAELERLRGAGDDPAVVLNQSIINGWKGLFQIKTGMSGAGDSLRARNMKAAQRAEKALFDDNDDEPKGRIIEHGTE